MGVGETPDRATHEGDTMHATAKADHDALPVRLRAAEERRDSLDVAIHAIAHDLRGQLGVVLGYADLLERRLDRTDEVAAEYADTIARVSEQLAAQVDRMMAVYGASRRSIRPERVDASAIARQVVIDLAAEGGRDDVRIDVADDLVVHADPLLLRLVLENLLSNALKATRDVESPVVEVGGGSVTDGVVELTVRDNGLGLDPAEVGRLFVPLGRLHDDEDFPGVGLGLASVARIVESHGGTVSGTGEPGTGATFTATFPTAVAG